MARTVLLSLSLFLFNHLSSTSATIDCSVVSEKVIADKFTKGSSSSSSQTLCDTVDLDGDGDTEYCDIEVDLGVYVFLYLLDEELDIVGRVHVDVHFGIDMRAVV